jgi:hypothetical protein
MWFCDRIHSHAIATQQNRVSLVKYLQHIIRSIGDAKFSFLHDLTKNFWTMHSSERSGSAAKRKKMKSLFGMAICCGLNLLYFKFMIENAPLVCELSVHPVYLYSLQYIWSSGFFPIRHAADEAEEEDELNRLSPRSPIVREARFDHKCWQIKVHSRHGTLGHQH